jgi:hypothetical protein
MRLELASAELLVSLYFHLCCSVIISNFKPDGYLVHQCVVYSWCSVRLTQVYIQTRK